MKVLDDSLLVEGLDAQAQVVDVSAFHTGTFATDSSELSVEGNQVDHRRTGSEVHQPQLGPASHHAAPQHLFVELNARCDVPDTKDDVIDAFNREGVHATIVRLLLSRARGQA